MKKNALLLGLCIIIYYIIKLYAQSGIEVELDDAQQAQVNKELLQAARHNEYNKIVRLISIEGADVNTVDKYGRTPLMWAALNSNIYAIETLLRFHPNLNLQDNDGNTAIHLALLPSPEQIVSSEERINSNDYKTLRMILAAGEDPSIRNKQGKTILDLAQDKPAQDLMTLAAIRMIRRYLVKHKKSDAAFKPCSRTNPIPEEKKRDDILVVPKAAEV